MRFNYRIATCAGFGLLAGGLLACGGDDTAGTAATGAPPPVAATAAPPPLAATAAPPPVAATAAPPPVAATAAPPPVAATAAPPPVAATAAPPPVAATGAQPPPPPPAPSGNNWSQMGYDARNWYFNPNESTLSTANAAQLVEKWRVGLGGFPPGTPLIVDGRVLVMTTTGIYALDLANGSEVWSRTDLAGTGSLAYDGTGLYAHAYLASDSVSTPYLVKLNATTGETIWGPEMTYAGPEAATRPCDATSSAIVGGGAVIVGRSCGAIEVGFGAGGGLVKGGLEAHSAETGAKLWSYVTAEGDEDGAMVWSSVGIDAANNKVYVATGNNYTVGGGNSDAMHAVDLTTGERLWKQQANTGDTWSLFVASGGPDTDFGANPIIAGDGIVAAGDKGSSFWAFDEGTGQVAWSRTGLSASRDAAHGGILMNGAFDGEAYYAVANNRGSGQANLVALNKADGTDKWPSKSLNGTAWGAPSLANGLLFVPISDRLLVFDAASGMELKSFEAGGTIAAGAPAVAQGHVCVQSGLEYPLSQTASANDEVICYGLP